MRTVNNHIFINKFPNYLNIKDKLIKEIRLVDSAPFGDVSLTDWKSYGNPTVGQYWNTLYPFVVESHLKIRAELYKQYAEYVSIDFGYVWFQIYGANSQHSYHTHPGCQFSNVFYVDLPDTEIKTEFFDIKSLDVEEGDMVTFPSYLLHRSPVNLDIKEKVIVAYNTSFNCNIKFDDIPTKSV